MGKWENAFSGSTLLANFVNRDPEQFVVRLEGFGSGNPNLSLTLRTANPGDFYPRLHNIPSPAQELPHLVNLLTPTLGKMVSAEYDDPAHSIGLTQRPSNSGKFYTAPQLLVSDGQDDAQPVTPADNAANDPTHRLALLGNVVVKPTINGLAQPDFLLDARPETTITVNVVVFNTVAGGSPVRSLSNVSDEWKAVRERFAQVGVKVDYTIRYGVNPAAGVSVSNVVAFKAPFTTLDSAEIPSATQTLISSHRNTSANYNVFYISGTIKQFETQSGTASGAAFMTFVLDAANDPFGNTALVSGTAAGLLTALHEIAHLLVNHFGQSPVQAGNELHHSILRNLLYYRPVHSRAPTASKRLDAYQESKIRQALGLPSL